MRSSSFVAILDFAYPAGSDMISSAGDLLHSTPHPVWDSRRLWSLADMINFGLHGFLLALEFLQYETDLARDACVSHADEIVSEAQNGRIKGNIERTVFPEIGRLALPESRIACCRLEDLFNYYNFRKYTYGELYVALERTLEDTKEGARQEYFFHYPREMANVALPIAIDNNWKDVLAGFPSARNDITAGIDCFAFGDYPGCIFHMIRIAERGLRLLAWERGITTTLRRNKPIEYAMWGEVISSVQVRIDEIAAAKGNKRPLTRKTRDNREIAVAFYRTILADMQSLQTLRDRTVHLRDTYDRGEAHTAMNRVQEMMIRMAPRLNEVAPAKIRWRL
jgi:hypothetical protein